MLKLILVSFVVSALTIATVLAGIVSDVLTEEKKQQKKQQVLGLGRLGWSLHRIEKQTGIRRETTATYLKAAGIPLLSPGAWGKRAPPKPVNEVTTDPTASASAGLPHLLRTALPDRLDRRCADLSIPAQ